MADSSDKKTVLIAGGSGELGYRVARAFLNHQRAHVNEIRLLLRRSMSEYSGLKKQRLDELKKGGVKFFVGDVVKNKGLEMAISGADIVVSCLQGDETVILEGQTRLLQMAKAVGVSRFIPSDFCINYFELDDNDNFNLALRHKFAAEVLHAQEEDGVPYTQILCGAFMDVLLGSSMLEMWNPDSSGGGEFNYWGSAQEEKTLDLITMDDAAVFTAAAALDPRAESCVLHVAGETNLTFPQLGQILSEVSDGEVQVRCLGTLDDLKQRINQRQCSDPDDISKWVGLQYVANMLSGARLTPINTQWYPSIKPTTFREFARKTDCGRKLMLVDVPTTQRRQRSSQRSERSEQRSAEHSLGGKIRSTFAHIRESVTGHGQSEQR